MAYQEERRDDEPFEKFLKRWKRGVKREGTLSELRNKEYYKKPTEVKKEKKKDAQNKTRMQQRADELT